MDRIGYGTTTGGFSPASRFTTQAARSSVVRAPPEEACAILSDCLAKDLQQTIERVKIAADRGLGTVIPR